MKNQQKRVIDLRNIIALMLLDGVGGEKNRQQAINWLKQAAKQDVKQAIEKLQSMNISFQSVESHP